MEATYIQILIPEILDWKYMTVLDNERINGDEKNAQQRIWAKVYIEYSRLL